MKLTTVEFASLLGIDRDGLRAFVNRHRLAPKDRAGRGPNGDKWDAWVVFCTCVCRRVRDRLGERCNPQPLHRYLLALGAAGFRDAVLAGRCMILAVQGLPMPMLVSRRSIMKSEAGDPIIRAAVGAEVLTIDLQEAWGEFAQTLEMLRDQKAATQRRNAKVRQFEVTFGNN